MIRVITVLMTMTMTMIPMIVLLLQAISIPIGIYLATSSSLSEMRSILGTPFVVARVSASMISINTVVILALAMKWYKRFIYIPQSAANHLVAVGFLYTWSITHTIAHLINFSHLGILCRCLTWGPGFTGVFICIILCFLAALSIPWMITQSHHIFKYIHGACIALYMGTTILHGTFCFTRYNDNSCVLPTFFWYALSVSFAFLVEWISRYGYSQTVSHTILYDGDVIQVVLPSRTHAHRGIVYVSCPDISLFEWHPFALTSTSFSQQDSFYVKLSGDWTRKLANRLGVVGQDGVPIIPCRLYIDGPYKSIQPVVQGSTIVATGVAMSSFITFLREVYHCATDAVIHVVWVTRNPTDIFHLEHLTRGSHLHLHVLTSEKGRPDVIGTLNKIKPSIIYYSGHKGLEKVVSTWAAKQSISVKK